MTLWRDFLSSPVWWAIFTAVVVTVSLWPFTAPAAIPAGAALWVGYGTLRWLT